MKLEVRHVNAVFDLKDIDLDTLVLLRKVMGGIDPDNLTKVNGGHEVPEGWWKLKDKLEVLEGYTTRNIYGECDLVANV